MPPTWSLHDQTAGVVLGTFTSRAQGDGAAALVTAGHAWTLWAWGDASSSTGDVADQGIGPLKDPFPIARVLYRIECVERPASASEHRRHVTGLGTVDADGSKRHWDDIALVRGAIASGDEFYTCYPTSTRNSSIESYDCSCGAETIRSCLDPPAERNLDNVAACRFR